METASKALVLINAFEVPVGADERFLQLWERSRDFLSSQRGYLSTALHQSLTPDADFRFVNIALWRSAAEFQAAMARMGANGAAFPFAAHPALYEVVRGGELSAGADDGVVLINPFEVAAGVDEEFIASWEVARDYLQSRPGLLGARLHRSAAPNADFRFVNVAYWQSPETFKAAIGSPGFQQLPAEPYPNHPALYHVVRR